jgi:hypothetical protein
LLNVLLALVAPIRPALATAPDFLPAYFGEALALGGHELQQVKRETENGLDRAVFLSSADGLLQITVEQLGCETPVCDAALENARAFLNEQATKGGGRFVAAKSDLLRTEWRSGLVGLNHVFVFRLPRSILFWSVALTPRKLDMDAYFETVEALVDRFRYEQAAAEDNVAMGRWGERIHAHARRLLASGDKEAALRVLRELLVTSPSAYAAHLDFAANATDAEAAKASARAVLAGTEDAEQAAAAAKFLGEPRISLDSLPVLERGDTGLQLILIALPPCDVQMVSEAARIYEQITNVPTKIRRLPGGWAWGEPDRVQGQRGLQSLMVKYRRANIDFSDWDKERYVAELAADAKKYDALSRYFLEDHIRSIEEGPGQYLVDPYLERLMDGVAAYRSAIRARSMSGSLRPTSMAATRTTCSAPTFRAANGARASSPTA